MRLWSLHPRYLDARGLVALWREGLLAQRVLLGQTPGYRHHPQLERFRSHHTPRGAIARYLDAVFAEALARGYGFDRSRIEARSEAAAPMEVTEGQLRHELAHLAGKLRVRNPERASRLCRDDVPDPHPLFVVIPGALASWERPGDPP